MENLNLAFEFVVDKIVSMQDYFLKTIAMKVGSIVFLIAIFTAALNYALTGTGLKENVIKIFKATCFFLIVAFAYPRIIGGITKLTFDLAHGSIVPSVETYYYANVDKMKGLVEDVTVTDVNVNTTLNAPNYNFVEVIKKTSPGDPRAYFDALIKPVSASGIDYSYVPPAAVFKLVLITAGACFQFAEPPKRSWYDINGKIADALDKIVPAIKGALCGFFIIFTGAFAVLEYVMAFMEFMLVASVGVILFPLSIWEGSKFMSEKFIGAIIGFFMKLLFCNIAIFLMIYGFLTLALQFASSDFTGEVDQIITIVFVCLLFLYICKSGPGLAQSLLSGVPSLSAAGAVSAAGGALAAAGAIQKGVGKVAGTAEKMAVGGVSSIAGGIAAGKAASAGAREKGHDEGISTAAGIAGFAGSVGKDAAGALGKGALGLTRSLLGMKGGVAGSKSQDDINSEKPLGERFNNAKDQGAKLGTGFAGRLPNNIIAPPPPPPPPPPPRPKMPRHR